MNYRVQIFVPQLLIQPRQQMNIFEPANRHCFLQEYCYISIVSGPQGLKLI